MGPLSEVLIAVRLKLVRQGHVELVSHLDPETLGKIAVGVDLNATHHRGVTAGTVTGIAVPLHLGSTVATYLEAGSRHPDDLTTCSDVDMMSSNRDGRFVHKDGTPYL